MLPVRTPRGLAILLSALFLAGPAAVFAAENHFRLLDWSDTDAKRGWYLELESKAAGEVLNVDALRLHLTVGDGSHWTRLEAARVFRAGERVVVAVKVSATHAELIVDGKPAAEADVRWTPLARAEAEIAKTMTWGNAPTRYRVHQGEWRLASGDQAVTGRAQPGVGGQLELFEYPLPQAVKLPALGAVPGLEFTTDFAVAAIAAPDLAGAVDRYGQATAADWPGKVHSDEDLKRAQREEAEHMKDWQRPADWDAFGGLKSSPWHEEATGYFRVTKRDGKWWLISPEGNPVFYTGMCVAPSLVWTVTPTDGREPIWQELPPRTGETASLWEQNTWADGDGNYFSSGGWNLLRKFGPDWQRLATADCARRMDAWGFTGLGKFCDRDDVPGKPRIETFKPGRKVKPLVRHIDVFDPKARAEMTAILDAMVKPWRENPRIVGFSVGNEYDDIFTTEEVRTVLEAHPDSFAAKALREAVKISATPTDAQIEQARRMYAEAYYRYIYETMKQLAPHHLYFGYWITPGWWQNESDWDMIVPYCDVLGYDKYTIEYGGPDGFVSRLIAKNDKPTLVGEFSFPAWYGGTRGFSRYFTFVDDDRASGEGYHRYVTAAAADPRCVGALWFQYRDDPITGWGGEGSPDALVRGEAFAQGLVDITDRPKWDAVERVRETNLRLTADRLKK